jgi:hypothetical protein
MESSMTPELREKRIQELEQKWRQVLLSRTSIDLTAVQSVIDRMYEFAGYSKPQIKLISNPYTGWSEIGRLSPRGFEVSILQMSYELQASLETAPQSLGFWETSPAKSRRYSGWRTMTALRQEIPKSRSGCLSVSVHEEMQKTAWMDYHINDLDFTHNAEAWELHQLFMQNCSWIFPYQHVCVVSELPTYLGLDNQHRPHGVGEPAVKYADGTSLYFYQGVALPEYMAQVHPDDWEAEWILTESNAERRRVLIHGVGYDKICAQLNATELSRWEDYSLLKIQDPVDIEPIHLLKMTCPSTGHIHAVRVPPNYQTARAALLWMNWGISPEKFAQQT